MGYIQNKKGYRTIELRQHENTINPKIFLTEAIYIFQKEPDSCQLSGLRFHG